MISVWQKCTLPLEQTSAKQKQDPLLKSVKKHRAVLSSGSSNKNSIVFTRDIISFKAHPIVNKPMVA